MAADRGLTLTKAGRLPGRHSRLCGLIIIKYLRVLNFGLEIDKDVGILGLLQTVKGLTLVEADRIPGQHLGVCSLILHQIPARDQMSK